jgi:oxygen-independent coproporphyrinogen-3 oxidase
MFHRIYIHVPFCISKCHYCAFISRSPKDDELAGYPALLAGELRLYDSARHPVSSIYFGGGTPSLLQPQQLASVIEAIANHSGISPEAEITLEANPGTVDYLALKACRDVGINRISFGIQSFDDHFLRNLGRIHTAAQSRTAVADVRKAGFSNVSLDLIHSLPGQSLAQWRSELLHAIDLCPEHISIYGLTIEEGTPFAGMYADTSPELCDDDLSADMFELADEILTASGFEHYEIANYARPGYRSRHNSGYWQRDTYLGLGVGAHSFLREGYGTRFSNPDTLEDYRSAILSGNRVRVGEHRLTKSEAMAEFLFLGLRLAQGVSVRDFEGDFGIPLESLYGPVLNDLVALGLIVRDGTAIMLTQRGMLLSNQVFERFL